MKSKIDILYLLLLMVVCSHAAEVNPNFIVFIADDVSWNDFGCYGNDVVKTPNIDRLAENGIRFDNVYLTASSCSPSRNSIITGRYPHNSGGAELHVQPPDEMISFLELLRNEGYYSALSGKDHLGDYANRGFDAMLSDRKVNGDGNEGTWRKFVQERPKEKPFFFWFASTDAHRNWGENEFSGTHDPDDIKPPLHLADGYDTRKDLAQYYDEVTRFDHYVGEVVKELRMQQVFEDTFIIVMADNGRCFPGGKTRLNDRGMKTPFVVHWPNYIKSRGVSSSSLISAIDIAPTILRLSGIEPAESFQGHSFEELLTHPDRPFRNYLFAEHNWHDYEAHQRMVRSREFLYILNSRPHFDQIGSADSYNNSSYRELVRLKDEGKLTAIQAEAFAVPRAREELYECNSDPLQYMNVASVPRYQDTLIHLRDTLKTWMREIGDSIPENLTKDWYVRDVGYQRTEQHGIRGDMPGSEFNATGINRKGPF